MIKQSTYKLSIAIAACMALPAAAQSLDELRKELAAAQSSIASLEKKIDELDSSEKREADFEVYGFAQLDYIQDFNRVNPNWDATLRPSRIPTEDGLYGGDGQSIASVRQSRLGVKANLPVGDDVVKTVFEFDMFGVGSDEGQTTMRLRHAYGEWRSILAGQTNSLFMDGDMFPNTIDYWGPAGMVFLRNPQLRWTPVKGANTFAVAIEKPGNDVDTGMVDAEGIQGDQPLPDVTAHYRNQGGWGHIQVAGILRQVAYESVASSDNEPDGNDLGWGINVSSNFKFGTDTLRLSTVYGEGIASYMNDGGMDMAPNNMDPGSLETVPLLGVVAYYDRNWSDKLSSAIGYSFTEVDNKDYQSPDAFNKGEYASFNLLYTPVKNVMMGAEYLWGKRTDNDGDTGADNRIQLTIKYSFSSLNF